MNRLSHLLWPTLLVVIMWPGQVAASVPYFRYELPQLYTFDDYDVCFQRNVSELRSTYCMLYAEVQPDDTSEMWHKIQSHGNASQFHYHHDRLFFGVCLDKCQKYIDQTSEEEAERFNASDYAVNNGITEFMTHVHKQPLDIEIRRRYSSALHKCVNEEFERKYGLNLRIFVKYCESRHYEEEQSAKAAKDPVENWLYTLLKFVLLLVVLSSIYDYTLLCQQTEEKQTDDFYKQNLNEPSDFLLTSFSICRNYYRLTQKYRSTTGDDFAFLDSYRAVVCLMAMLGHTYVSFFQHVQNPEFFEQSFGSTGRLMMLNATLIIQIFLVISGLLYYIKFTTSRHVTPQTSLSKCFKIFVQFCFMRFLRYLPSIGLLIWFSGTTFPRMAHGPFWRHMTDPISVFSRENWWKNILLINNFSVKDTMFPHTWYIAADMQLFVLYTIVIIAISKYPQFKVRILSAMGALAIIIPTAVSYFLKQKSAFILRPESYRYAHFVDTEEFSTIYSPFYCHLGGYLMGIICGDVYLNYLSKPEYRKKFYRVWQYEVSAYGILAAALGILWWGTVMMFKEPSIWTALFCGLNGNLWVIFVCGLPVMCMSCGMGTILLKFCRLPMFRIIGRLTFQMYLWHFLVLVILKGRLQQPYRLDTLYMASLSIVAYVSSAIISFLVILFFEYPFAQLQEALQRRISRKSSSGPPKTTKVQ